MAGSWLTKSGQPNQKEIAPNADFVQSDVRDYLAVSVNTTDLPVKKLTNIVPLLQYYVLPHTGLHTFLSESHITYALDASNLTINPQALEAYGISAKQKTQQDPVVHLTAIDQSQLFSGVTPETSAGKALGFKKATNVQSNLMFQVGQCSQGTWPQGVTPPQGQFCLQIEALKTLQPTDDGVYQINTRAYNRQSGNSAFATFYVYLNAITPDLAKWNAGALPNFNALQYVPGQKFGTACLLYTSPSPRD